MKTPLLEKICPKCKINKKVIEFNKDRSKSNGYNSKCKDCVKEYKLKNKEHFANYALGRKEIAKEYSSKYRQENKEALKIRSAEYYQDNKQLILDKTKIYYENNKEECNKKNRHYAINNRDKVRINANKYIKSEKGKITRKTAKAKRRARERNVKDDLSKEQVKKLVDESNNICYWCNDKINGTYNIDHYIPIAKGGENTISNLVVSCAKCNQSKNAKDPIEFANSIGKLL